MLVLGRVFGSQKSQLHRIDCASYMIGFIVLLEPIWMVTFPAILQGRGKGKLMLLGKQNFMICWNLSAG